MSRRTCRPGWAHTTDGAPWAMCLEGNISCFWQNACGILETQKLFPWNYLTHKTTYAYLSLFMGCWDIQNKLDSDLFWAGDGRFCEDFLPFGVLMPREQTCQLIDCTQKLRFLRRIFWAHKKSGNFVPRQVTRFSWIAPIPLLHPNVHNTLMYICYVLCSL